MLDMLEKLINEHGSSAILRERLELFSDKYFFDTAVDLTAERVCQQFSLEPGIAQYHIDNLMEKELLTHGALYVNQPMRYCISKRGRAYIIEQTTTE
jgi:hypothetical protein